MAEPYEPQAGIDYDFDFDDESEDEAHDACGRWMNGKFTRSCSQAGTEYCDFECPYREQRKVA